jgi:hypothetical protein
MMRIVRQSNHLHSSQFSDGEKYRKIKTIKYKQNPLVSESPRHEVLWVTIFPPPLPSPPPFLLLNSYSVSATTQYLLQVSSLKYVNSFLKLELLIVISAYSILMGHVTTYSNSWRTCPLDFWPNWPTDPWHSDPLLILVWRSSCICPCCPLDPSMLAQCKYQ